MIIRDFNVVSLFILKPEADPPLIIDANAPLPDAIPGQRFQVVGWRHAEVAENSDCINLCQSHYGPFQNIGQKPCGFAGSIETLCVGIRKCPNHGNNYKQFVYNYQLIHHRKEYEDGQDQG
jgi:hypothetical protein